MVPSTVYCDHCGAANRPQARFCIACGQAMSVASSLPPTALAGSTISSTPPVLARSGGSASSSTGQLPANFLLNQRYLILSRVGQGGMGAVYQAADTHLGDRLVAVKEMSHKGLDPHEIADAVAAFKREANLLASLRNTHLPRIYDHFADGGRWYLVMDFIDGLTLEAYLDQAGGTLPVEEVLDIGSQLCTVLAYLHQHQPPIIFRDLKPANVIRTPDGDLILIDFGIARHFKPGQARDTAAYGSMGYAAPEQFGTAQTTPQSDLFSLGATLHQLLTGLDPSQTPFDFAPLSSSSIPPTLESLIQRMVKTVPSERPASMLEVKEDLQHIAIQARKKPARPKKASSSSPPAHKKAHHNHQQLTSTVASPSPPKASAQAVVSPTRQHRFSKYRGYLLLIAWGVVTGIGFWWVFSPLYLFKFKDPSGMGGCYGFASLTLGLLLSGIALVESRIQSKLKTRGITVNGCVTNHSIEKSGTSFYYYVTYSYECNGQTYSCKIKVNQEQYEAWDKGASVSVCYLPDEPQVSRLAPLESNVGVKVGCATLCFLITLFIVLGIIFGFITAE